MRSSPAQRMFGRRTRTLLPTARQLLKPELVKDVRHKKYQRQEKQTHYYNQNTKELPGLKEGETVRMKPMSGDSKHRWIKAQVEDQVDVWSYAVRTEDGRRFRRNRRHLRQSREMFGSKDAVMIWHTIPRFQTSFPLHLSQAKVTRPPPLILKIMQSLRPDQQYQRRPYS